MADRSDGEKRTIMEEARMRFRRAMDWESTARARFRDDIKFAEGDARNNYQWPADQLTDRNKRPSLTINRVRQHNLDILNDARQSRVAVKVRPLRGGASYDSAMILDGVIKHIEYISNADVAYQNALKFAVQGGIGYIRLVTDYADDESFDQEVFIRGVDDPLTILLDPDISDASGIDGLFGFIFNDMPKDEFDKAYPKLKDVSADSELAPDVSWVMGERVRIAEYFRCVKEDRKLYGYTDPQTGERVVKSEKDIDEERLKAIIDDPETALRSVVFTKVEHFTIIGDHITEEKEWPGRYVPILRCVGEQTVIDGQMDRKGHTRALLDAQRMFNYNASGAIEYGALQSKIPYVAPAAAIEGYDEYWKAANTDNFSVLPFNHVDEDGEPVPAPVRQQPPTSAPVYMQGMRDAMEQMYLASGQNQADFGQPGNEKSGVAIQQRQRQGDNATYHYVAHQADMILGLGKQLLDVLPHVYDTARTVKFRDDAGNEGDVNIDPDAPEHFTQTKDQDGNTNSTINLKMGAYDVQADVGPAYATRRQEAFAAFSQLLGANKELFALVGDIWMRFADIPGGEEAAERLKRMVPAQATGEGPPPELAQAQQQLKEATDLIHQLTMKLDDKSGKNTYENEKNAITAYKATTERLAALKEALATDPQGLLVLVREIVEEAQAQSAGGNALAHILEGTLDSDQISPAMGGTLQPPAPHTPPVDPNNLIPSPDPVTEPSGS